MIYPYRCQKCGATFDVHQRLAEYVAKPLIPACSEHGSMVRVFTVPMVAADYQPFVSHLDGTVINSRSQQKEHMARHGVVLYDDFASELPAKRQAIEDAHFKEIRQDVHEAMTKVGQGYVPAQEMVGQDDNGIDVLHTDALPKELKSEITVEV